MHDICIDVDHLTFSYTKDRPVLEGISFHAEAADSIGIVGANGVGKSTLLKLLVGLELNFSGHIRVGNVLVEKKNLEQLRKKTGYVFQDAESQLFMSTVYEDIAFGPRNYGLSETETEQCVREALERVGAADLRDRHIYALSGGQKKLVSIAAILSMQPDIILMDEPSVALDPRNRRNLIYLLNSFDQLKIIASHDLDFILDTCKQTILLSDGRIVKTGETHDILTDKELLEAHGLELPLSLYNKK